MSESRQPSAVSADPSLLRILTDFAKVMRSWGNRWYVFGAQAVMLWGHPRMSADVDVTAQIPWEDIPKLVGAMQEHGFDLRIDSYEGFVERTRVLPFLHRPTQFPLDVVLAGPGLEEEFLDRARLVPMGRVRVPVISPEDLIVSKILAGRPKDLEDVRGILEEQLGALDLSRIQGLLSLLEEVLTRSDLLSVLKQLLDSAGRE